MEKKSLVIIFIAAIVLFFFTTSSVSADELSDVEKQLGDLKHALELSIAATTPLEGSLTKLNATLGDIKRKTILIEQEVRQKEALVLEGEDLLVSATELLGQKVKQMYKSRTVFSSPGIFLLMNENLPQAVRVFGYQKKVVKNDRDTIVKIVLYVKDLEERKKQLEGEKVRLAVIKEETDKQTQFLEKEIKGAKKYQSALSSQIAQVSARQKQLLAEKLGSLNLPTSLGAGPLYCTDDRKIDPGFSPAFAFFTYGIPHRVGLNQYGAYGRAKAGQSYRDILGSYFDGISYEKKDAHMKIKIQGYGEKDLDDYLLGIYEMPENWPLEALKSQAVAARSYALSYTNNGASEICTTQACQVYKQPNKSGDWMKAVKDTEGEVMVRDGQVIKAWYASTFGGYSFTSGDVWGSNRSYTKRMRDTTGDIGSFGDLADRSYDRESPCFYAAQGYRSQYGKSAWLKSEELADIVNVLRLAKKDSSTQQHLSQLDKPNPDGADTWDAGRVRQELQNRGETPLVDVSIVSIEWDKGIGKTTRVNVSGSGGSFSFDGSEFNQFFNLRAPANIQIVGPLYNIEKR